MQTFQRKVLLLFASAVLLGVVFIGLIMANAYEGQETRQQASDSRERLLLLKDMVATLFEAESSQRAYAASGDPLFKEEHVIVRRELETILTQLRQQTFPEAISTDQIAQLADLIELRAQSMDELVQIRDEEGTAAAAAYIETHKGERLTDRIRTISNNILDTEASVLANRRATVQRHEQQLFYLLGGGGLLNILLLGWAFILIRHEQRRAETSVDQLRAYSDEITYINQLSNSLQSCESQAAAAEVIQHFMQLLFPATRGGFYMMRASRNLLQLAARWGDDDDTNPLVDPIEPNDCWALRLGRLHSLRSTLTDLRCHHAAQHSGHYICVPMMAQGETVGLLHLRPAADNAIDVMEKRAGILAAHIGSALASISLREALQQQNIRDPLTGLYNRRYLEETVEREHLRAQRDNSGLGVIMVDIDHFKQFNDNHGHQAGDLQLKEFAHYLRRHIRGEDIACRYGGEEFVLLLPGSTLEQARDRAESLRQGLSSLQLDFHGQSLPTVTASFGVAAFTNQDQDWETVLHLADTALYQAKRAGRDRVVVTDYGDKTSAANPA
ncbi:diguanylate cyclase (GGDEF)-like protein [Methylohalomonas lacus]|uniref:diguanylate cyclase n=1 Tax=Methylohalomonas lacus TaxID=398773 RepID=A0AAE3HKM3_9GAMM|nr:diguanylate cyclase [Methylohalomonas lacus]MCS3902173.1 diguanylate cyclase (GGDEF)-like protein [Methylohalomonas lacus]